MSRLTQIFHIHSESLLRESNELNKRFYLPLNDFNDEINRYLSSVRVELNRSYRLDMLKQTLSFSIDILNDSSINFNTRSTLRVILKTNNVLLNSVGLKIDFKIPNGHKKRILKKKIEELREKLIDLHKSVMEGLFDKVDLIVRVYKKLFLAVYLRFEEMYKKMTEIKGILKNDYEIKWYDIRQSKINSLMEKIDTNLLIFFDHDFLNKLCDQIYGNVVLKNENDFMETKRNRLKDSILKNLNFNDRVNYNIEELQINVKKIKKTFSRNPKLIVDLLLLKRLINEKLIERGMCERLDRLNLTKSPSLVFQDQLMFLHQFNQHIANPIGGLIKVYSKIINEIFKSINIK